MQLKQIINSLLELLERKEYHDITIHMIVDHAGLGRRTFYRYFKTKDDAMEYITRLLMDQFASAVIRNNSHGTQEVAIAYNYSLSSLKQVVYHSVDYRIPSKTRNIFFVL